MNKVKYTCKNCGWETSIRAEWGDLRPKRCMNKKCNTSFLAHPDALIIVRPEAKPANPHTGSSMESFLQEENIVVDDEKLEERKHGRKRRSQSGEVK